MNFNHKAWVLTAAAVVCSQAQAYDFTLENGVKGKLDGVPGERVVVDGAMLLEQIFGSEGT